ncbi:MAG: hypothetical protein LBP80_05150 [Treponema sp.]|jgi:hypothetical protein|nr:hypothetical protein [Treponema sp.]
MNWQKTDHNPHSLADKFLFSFAIFTFTAGLTSLSAQDFGFGNDEGDSFSGAAAAVSVGGEVSASMLGYFDDFSNGLGETRLGDIFSGKLNFSASGSNADGFVNLNLKPVFDGTASPITIDEAYLRAFFGNFNIEAGLRKLTWGKADSMGPLDVINPLDYSDMTDLLDSSGLKIARPLLRLSYNFGTFSKLEGVFVPWFEASRSASSGRWAPGQMETLPAEIIAGLVSLAPPPFQSSIQTALAGSLDASNLSGGKDTSALEYAQAGLRFTTTVGSSDMGVQYYFGRLPQPAISIEGAGPLASLANPADVPGVLQGIHPVIEYNRYHQIGLDYARVVRGFNIRAELAANITGDFAGDDGAVYNPSIAWSFGFDRETVWGITANLQAGEKIILLHDRIGNNAALDTEAGTGLTSTRIIASLSKKLLRDELDVNVKAIWGIEDRDFLIAPGITWTKGNVGVDCVFGIIGGDEAGQFGQYHENSFVKLGLTYMF